MPKWGAQHYNALAKEIRTLYGDVIFNDEGPHANLKALRTLEELALRLAKRFEADSEAFKPLMFMDACSPNTDRYPLSELWEDYHRNLDYSKEN